MSESLYDIFGADETSSEDGKWFPFGKTIEVKIRRYKSKKSRKVREELEKPYKRATGFGGGKLPDDILEEISVDHIAEGLIADWRGVTDRAGNPVKYTVAAARSLLKDLPEFRDAIADISLNLENFREEEKEAIEGN